MNLFSERFILLSARVISPSIVKIDQSVYDKMLINLLEIPIPQW